MLVRPLCPPQVKIKLDPVKQIHKLKDGASININIDTMEFTKVTHHSVHFHNNFRSIFAIFSNFGIYRELRPNCQTMSRRLPHQGYTIRNGIGDFRVRSSMIVSCSWTICQTMSGRLPHQGYTIQNGNRRVPYTNVTDRFMFVNWQVNEQSNYRTLSDKRIAVTRNIVLA